MPGLRVGQKTIDNLRHADNTVLLQNTRSLLNAVKNKSRKKGLDLNRKKTEVVAIKNISIF